MKVSFVEGVVGACARYAGLVVPLFLVLGIAGAYYSATHFRMTILILKSKSYSSTKHSRVRALAPH